MDSDTEHTTEQASAPLRPDISVINGHLYTLFAPTFVKNYPDAQIEIAYSDTEGNVNAAENFSAFDLAAAAEFAARKNLEGCNVYVGAALRDGKSTGRANKTNFKAATFAWVEFDKSGDYERIGDVLQEKNLPTALTVITGKTPNRRAHLYFRIEPVKTAKEIEAANKALQTLLGSDNVSNADRVMRLAGTVNYPTAKKAERGYIPELVTLYVRGREKAPTYTVEQLARIAGRPSPSESKATRTTIEIGDNFWRNVNTMALANLDSWVMTVFPDAKRLSSSGVWRVSSKALGRDLEEDLSLSKDGIKDFGVHDIGDKREGKRTAVDIVVEHGGAPDIKAAALWLCEKCGAAPASLGWGSPPPQAATGDIDPVDLWGKLDPPNLPRGVLPRLIEDFAVDRGTTMGCDMSGIAVGALAVCAGAISDNIRLQPKKHDTEWLESARLWGLEIGDPSTMKTPSISAVTKPLRRIDSELAHNYQTEMDRWLRLSKDDQKTTPKPKKLRAMIFDTTIESTQEILRDSPDGVLLEDDELSGWFDAMYKYNSGTRGAQKDRAFWLKGYDGGPKTVDRIMRGTVHIPNLSISIIGGSQPGPLCVIADSGVDDGLLQRFNPVMLRPAIDGNDRKPGQAVFDYAKLIRMLRELKMPKPEGIPLTFDDGALAIREKLERKHLELMKLEGINRKLTSHFGKYNGMFARLCLIWHCIEHVSADTGRELPHIITEATAKRVANFLHGFLRPHAVAFYVGILGLANDHDRLANVADYILARKLERVTNRHIQRGDRTMRDLKRRETDAIFEQLEALGWLTRTPATRPSDPPHWLVNPIVHQRFAAQAKISKARRERDRGLIDELLKGTV